MSRPAELLVAEHHQLYKRIHQVLPELHFDDRRFVLMVHMQVDEILNLREVIAYPGMTCLGELVRVFERAYGTVGDENAAGSDLARPPRDAGG